MIDLKTPLPWLLGSVALAVVATNLAWAATRRATDRPIAAVLPVLGWLAVSLFHLLPPIGAWQSGALSPYWLGVAEIDWVASMASGAPLVALLGGVLVFGWLVYRRSLPRDAQAAARKRRTPGLAPERSPATSCGVRPSSLPVAPHAAWGAAPISLTGRSVRLSCALALRALVDAALLQWHWAFYRALAIGVLASGAAPLGLAAQPVYWGTWLATGAAAVEWALNPYARAALRQAGRREAALRQAALALGTAALFLLTRNFYLGLLLHLATELLIVGWFPLPAAAEETESPRIQV